VTLYLYAIIDKPPPADARIGNGIARKPLSVVRVGRAFVVVEPAEGCDPTPHAIVAHDRVVRRVARISPAVLPLRFGSTTESRAEVQALLLPLAAPIKRAFERVRGAVQFTLRVTGRRRSAEPVHVPAVGPGTRWLAERMAAQRVSEIACITEATRPWVREIRSQRHDLLRSARAEASGSGHRKGPREPFATVYHLVSRDSVRAWRLAFRRSMANLPPDVCVTMTGPWPAYAFAELA
jgi:hypothetical protein